MNGRLHIAITGHHIDLTEAIKKHVQNKLGKIAQHFQQALHIRVVLSVKEHNQKQAEVLFSANGHDFVAQETHADMYTAIDHVAQTLYRQIVKHKEKVVTHRTPVS